MKILYFSSLLMCFMKIFCFSILLFHSFLNNVSNYNISKEQKKYSFRCKQFKMKCIIVNSNCKETNKHKLLKEGEVFVFTMQKVLWKSILCFLSITCSYLFPLTKKGLFLQMYLILHWINSILVSSRKLKVVWQKWEKLHDSSRENEMF